MADDDSVSPVYAILDVETTGLSRKQDRIVQIACLKIGKDDSRKTWMRYVNPQMDSKYLKQAFSIHRIPPDFLKDKPLFKDVAKSFCDFLKDVDYLVGHNCVFDWDMLCREFEIIDQNKKDESSEEDFSELWWKKFHCEKNWVDTLRLAMVCFPRRETYRLGAIKEFLKIEPLQGIAGGDLAQRDHGGDEWKIHQHDAMYDVLTTYGVLQHCIKSNFCDLLKKYPMVLLDTPLLIDMQNLIDQKKTSTQNLLPFAQRSKEYFTTSRPRGKKLGDLSKNYLQMMTFYSKADERSDNRVLLIYEAAILEPMENEMVSHSSFLYEEIEEKEKKVDGKKKMVEEKEKVENEKMKKEEQEKRNESELVSHSSASLKGNAEIYESREYQAEEDESKAEIAKETEEEEKKKEYVGKEQRMEDKMEKNRSEEKIAKIEEELEKEQIIEKYERVEDNKMEEIKREAEVDNEMKGEQEKKETVEKVETVEDKVGEDEDEEFVTQLKKEKCEKVEKEVEDKMEEIKGEAEIVKKIKEEQNKMVGDDDEEEKFNCSCPKRTKLSLQ